MLAYLLLNNISETHKMNKPTHFAIEVGCGYRNKEEKSKRKLIGKVKKKNF